MGSTVREAVPLGLTRSRYSRPRWWRRLFEALLVNLDQEDQLVLQALEVPSPPSRRVRLGHL